MERGIKIREIKIPTPLIPIEFIMFFMTNEDLSPSLKAAVSLLEIKLKLGILEKKLKIFLTIKR